MDSGLVDLIVTVGKNSPELVIIGGLAYVIWFLAKNQAPATTAVKEDLHTIKTNHLHELPAIAENIRKIADSAERQAELAEHTNRVLVALDSYTRVRLNGGGNHGR